MNQPDWFSLYLEAKERHPGMISVIRDGDAYHSSARMPKLSGLCVTYACFPAVGPGCTSTCWKAAYGNCCTRAIGLPFVTR